MYVPERLRARILLYYHSSRVGAQKMIVRIKKHFYWPLLARDCVDFTAGCLTCQRRMNMVNLVGKGVLLSTDFNILVSVDAIGPFMYRENGAMYAGRDFCDKVESLGIRTSNATPQYPQGNSMVASFHHFLKGALSRTSVNNWSFEKLRFEAFEQAISRQALTSTKKDDRKFELGDGEIYQLTKKDSEKLVKYYGTDKLMLAWSEQMRITKVLHPQQGTYLLESVWHKGFKRQVNKRSHVVSIQCQPEEKADQ
ncbi:hypothetical protein GNI_229480 [Gregarina niphandrodes]|uniref:Integrase zinc-binding domain-containing protein n=1 Tax=Gregarina niphandrodes TaxID=110365 RepID=A0A023AVE6_GRENI|nr:hypothetical protein GNI_229480 [Gregarina niphandrodes]EZG42759.1 hypothetical protein GNI_229480 [Gregarina niphandrodes]|eukprot:XP_011133962.1 hypothetical protein GNI_229480 [Gregarina niphandrodes]